MTFWLKTLVALAEDPGLLLSTHLVAHKYPKFQFRGSDALDAPYWALQAPRTHMVRIRTACKTPASEE